MDYLKRNVEESMLQSGVIVSGVLAIISGCMSNSMNSLLSTYVVCLMAVFLVLVPDWKYFMRAPCDWADEIFVETVVVTKQIRRLALEQDMDLFADGSISHRRSSSSDPSDNFIGSAMSQQIALHSKSLKL